MLKKFTTTFAAINFAFAGAAIMASSQAQAVELKFVHAYSTAAQHHKNVEWYTEQVTERTNGEVTFKIYPGAQLMPINQELPAILSGQVSMTYSLAAIASSIEPLWGVFDLPFLFDAKVNDTSFATAYFNHEKGGGMLADKMEKRGFKLITIAATDWFSSVYLTGSEAPRKIEDLKGLKIRNTGGEIANKTGDAFGYNPIAVAGAELVPALTQGVVDGGVLSPLYVYDNKLPLKGISIAPMTLVAATPIIMSLAEFKKLTPEQQQIMMDVGSDLQTRAQKIVEEKTENVVKLLAEDGADVAILSEEDIAEWRKHAQPVWQDFIKKHGADAEEMIKAATNK